jgi:Heterokaryon incompatibility protein (HET)
MGTIQYTPLDPDKAEIRLIELLPRASNSSDQIERFPQCNLIHVSLLEEPEYIALSYTWGDPQDTQPITVGHRSVAVTRNLYSALGHLQNENTARFIWIDAICINQLDNEEKCWQVQFMRSIYQRATFVCIWLGPANTATDKAMDVLHSVGIKARNLGLDGSQGPQILMEAMKQWRKLACQPSSTDAQSKRVDLGSPEGTVEDGASLTGDLKELYHTISGCCKQENLFPVEGLNNLFTRLWWSRIWVLQELALARCAVFVCGTKWLNRCCFTAAFNSFKALSYALQHQIAFGKATPTLYQKSVATATFDGRPTLILDMWATQRHSPLPLLALLRITCNEGAKALGTFKKHHHLDATDPRDKIYGLLGLAADRDQLKDFGIQPDYTRPCRELYISITIAMLRQGYLSVLSLSQFPKTQIGLPSWVPDWSIPLKKPLQSTRADYMTLHPEYTASGSLTPNEIRFNRVGLTVILSVSGFVYDEVHETGNTWAEFLPSKQSVFSYYGLLTSLKMFLAELIRLSFLRNTPYKSLKERICAVSRTAAADSGFAESDTMERIGNRRYDIVVPLLMFCFRNELGWSMLLAAGLLDLIQSELATSGWLQSGFDSTVLGHYFSEVEGQARGKKPFVTAKGYLGLGPDHVKSGDVVAVLLGCQVPFLLRKSAHGKYEVIGEVYVDGIMDGEAMLGCGRVEMIQLC